VWASRSAGSIVATLPVDRGVVAVAEQGEDARRSQYPADLRESRLAVERVEGGAGDDSFAAVSCRSLGVSVGDRHRLILVGG
jgi:hypothetical protein